MKDTDTTDSITPDVTAMRSDMQGPHDALAQESIEWSKKIYEQNVRILRYMRWASVMSILRIALIIVPIILGFIFLPPLLSTVVQQYESIVGVGGSIQGIDDVLKELHTDQGCASLNALIEQFRQ